MSGVSSIYYRLDEAADAMKREIDYYKQSENAGLVNKLVMGIVLIHLHRGDYVAADQAFKSCLSRSVTYNDQLVFCL